MNETVYLIWEASGENTLEDYIEMDNGWVRLAQDLGVSMKEIENDVDRNALHQRVAKEVLRQLLEGIAYCHSLGLIHRDIKVRMETSQLNCASDESTKYLAQ
jgi:serine/threonine protein kinase